MQFLILFFIITTLSMACMSSPTLHRKECVLPVNVTKEVCEDVNSVEPRNQEPPCPRDDIICWNKLALKYTNDVRKDNNVDLLKLGPNRQLRNAMKYAQTLSKMGKLKHQKLPDATAVVKCKRFIAGENLAYNYESGDISRACVDQWIKSPSHFENLIRDFFEEMVVGYHFDNDGRVYCVQTFGLEWPIATFGSTEGPGCDKIA